MHLHTNDEGWLGHPYSTVITVTVDSCYHCTWIPSFFLKGNSSLSSCSLLLFQVKKSWWSFQKELLFVILYCSSSELCIKVLCHAQGQIYLKSCQGINFLKAHRLRKVRSVGRSMKGGIFFFMNKGLKYIQSIFLSCHGKSKETVWKKRIYLTQRKSDFKKYIPLKQHLVFQLLNHYSQVSASAQCDGNSPWQPPHLIVFLYPEH